MGKGRGNRDGEGGEEDGRREGREREGMEEGRGKVTEGTGGTGRGRIWDGTEEGKGGRCEREERGYSPQTSIPDAATADLDPYFVNPGSAPASSNILKCDVLGISQLFY